MVLCFKLYFIKDATICTTAAATVRQMVSVIFERVITEDKQGLGTNALWPMHLITLNFYLPLIFKLNYWSCDTLKNPGLFFLRNDWVLITCSTCGCEKCHPGILVNEFVHIYMWDTCYKKLYHTINPKS